MSEHVSLKSSVAKQSHHKRVNRHRSMPRLPDFETIEPRRLLSAYNPLPVPLITVTHGSSNSVIVATFESSSAIANLSATINWPDATVSAGTITTIGSVFVPGMGTIPQYKVTGTFMPSTPPSTNQQQFTVSVHDTGDATSAVVIDAMQVIAAPISFVTAQGPFVATEGQTFLQDEIAIISDPDPSAGSNDFAGTVDWGDGSPLSSAVISPIGGGDFGVFVDHTFNSSLAMVTPKISVSNASGQTIHITAGPVTVNDAPLSPGLPTPPLTGIEGQSLSNQLIATFIDSNPLASPADFTTFISWGDGTGTDTTTGDVHLIGNNAGQSRFLVYGTHTYASAARNAYPITVTILDSHGSSLNNLTSSATIAHRAPVADALFADGNDVTGVAGQVVSGTVALFSDLNLAALPVNFAASIAWGDGKSSIGTIVNDGNGNFHVTGSHTFAKEKASGYAIGVKIAVVGTKTSTSTTATAHITDAPLTAGSPLSLPIARNKDFTLILGSFTDQDALNTKPADYINANSIIDWGDGSPHTILTAANLKRTGANASGSFWNVLGKHRYTTAGQKSVTIIIQDIGGQATALTLTITVT